MDYYKEDFDDVTLMNGCISRVILFRDACLNPWRLQAVHLKWLPDLTSLRAEERQHLDHHQLVHSS